MDDLISKQAAIDAIGRDPMGGLNYERILKYLPTAEPKTGRWMISETAYEDTEAKCSECGFVTLVNETGNGLHMLSELRFCPNCGAKMGGGKDEC